MYNTAYDTMYGKISYIEEVKKDIANYLATGVDLSFGYTTGGNCELAFLTGINETEQAIPGLEYPLPLVKKNGNSTLVTDMRYFTLSKIEGIPTSLDDIIKTKDVALATYAIHRAFITADYYVENVNPYLPLYKYVASCYAMVISNCCKKLAYLSPVDILNIEIAAAYYYTIKSSPESQLVETKQNMVTRLSNVTYSIPAITYEMLNTVVSELNEIKVDEYTFITLVEMIVKILHDETKSRYIFPKSLGQQITSLWYGFGGGTNLLISMDDVAGFLAIVGLAIGDVNLKKSKLVGCFLNNKKFKTKEFIVDYNKILGDRIVSKEPIPMMSKVLGKDEVRPITIRKIPKDVGSKPIPAPPSPVANTNIKSGGSYEW